MPLSIIVPAFNEEGNIQAVCEGLRRIADQTLDDYEILLFDDASRDRTAVIARTMEKTHSRLRVIQNPVNRGLGYNYREGALRAKFDYVAIVPGDNEVLPESLIEMFRRVGSADLVLGYSANASIRPWQRRFISRVYTRFLNLLFGLKVRYFNGPTVVRTDLARRFAPASESFAYMAVTVVRSLKTGSSYCEVPFRIQARNYGKTKAFKFKNVVKVVRDILTLWWQIFIRSNR